MPGRKIPLITGEIYHVFNRGIDRRPTFTTRYEYKRALQTLAFYKFKKPPFSLSRYLNFNKEQQSSAKLLLNSCTRLVEIKTYCLMPNHFHLLIQQMEDKGISSFMSNFQNSYTRFFNTKQKRDGPLFLDQFKAVHIETDQQFLHTDRYIHLNPYTSYIVETYEKLELYPWSSFQSYLTGQSEIVNSTQILQYFKNVKSYRSFVLDRADYQRELKKIQHIILE